jgi:hypothetical protein
MSSDLARARLRDVLIFVAILEVRDKDVEGEALRLHENGSALSWE